VAVWISLGFVTFTLRRLCFLHKIAVCQNAVLKECFYRTNVDYLFYEYNVNFTFSLSVVSDAVYKKFCDICGMRYFSQFYLIFYVV